MYCPNCAAEYREGFDRCQDCDVALVTQAPEATDLDEDWTIVHETSELDVLPVIKSLLRGAEIPFQTRGEDLMNLFPSEALNPLYTRHSGEVRVLVPPNLAEEARALLAADFEMADDEDVRPDD